MMKPMTGETFRRANAGMTMPAAPRIVSASLRPWPLMLVSPAIPSLEQVRGPLSPPSVGFVEVRMAKQLKADDRVSWNSHGRKAHGKVVMKVTSETSIKGHKVAASKDNPEYLVETDEGKQAAHKAEALTKA